MVRFETPIGDPALKQKLDGLDCQSVRLAQSFERNSRLNAFVDTFVAPDEIQLDVAEQGLLTYDTRCLSAIGDEGSLVHIRLRQRTLGESVDSSTRYIVAISHVDDPNPATVQTATADQFMRDGSWQHTYTIGTPEEANLLLLTTPMDEEQLAMERILRGEEAVNAMPLIVITTNGWEYRRSDGHWTKLHDLLNVRERVSMALSRGLGYAALPQAHVEPLEDHGQLEQKMVG